MILIAHTAECDGCGATSATQHLPLGMYMAHIMDLGWRPLGPRVYCAQCAAKERVA